MPGKHPPGYWGRRYRIQQHVLNHFKTTNPDEYQAAWEAGEAAEQEREENQ